MLLLIIYQAREQSYKVSPLLKINETH